MSVGEDTIAGAKLTPQIRRAPGLNLAAAELALLERAFAGHPEIFIEAEMRSGYSGATVFLVSPGPGLAYAVVKLGPPADLRREYEAYRHFVEPAAPQNTARLQGEPLVAADGYLALLRYTFAGGDPRQPTCSLQTYYERKGGQMAAATLDRIFRVYGRQWWAINRPGKFSLSERYDRLLPVHLRLKLGTPGKMPVKVFPAGQLTASALHDLRPGQGVQLHGFRVSEVRPDRNLIKLTANPPPGEASAPIRLNLEIPATATYQPGDPVDSLEAVVIATRQTALAAAARSALNHRATVLTFDPTAAHFNLNGLWYANPLYDVADLLNRFVEGRVSTIHGDLNLQNILIDETTGFAWLIDFAETGPGPTLFDLQWLEGQLITKLLPGAVVQSGLGPAAVVTLLAALHADPPMPTAPHPALQEPYIFLVALRRLARQYLMDDRDWDEYYLGLMVALLGTLKFPELSPLARGLAFLGAAAARGLLRQPLPPLPVEGASSSPTLTLEEDDSTLVAVASPFQPGVPKPRPSWQLPRLVGILLTLAFLFLLWLGLGLWPRLTSPPPPLAYVAALDGQVEVRRRSSDRLIPADFGLELFREDAVITYETSQAHILCRNGLMFSLTERQTLTVRCEETADTTSIGQLPTDLVRPLFAAPETRPASAPPVDVMKLEQNLRVSPLPAEAQRFLRAKLYAYNGRPEQAINELESLVAQSQSSGLAQALGDLYLQLGVLDKATTNYLLAWQTANASADLTAKAGAYLGLGHVAKARGQTEVAQAYWQSSADLYRQAGDTLLAARVIFLLRPVPSLSDLLVRARLALWPVVILFLCGLALSLGFYWWRRRRRPRPLG